MPAAENGRNGSRWFSVAMFLLGAVLTGTLSAIRGDYLGTKAAEAVEIRLTARDQERLNRIERLEDNQKEIMKMLSRIDGKLGAQ